MRAERKRTRSQMPKTLWVGYDRGEYLTYTGQQTERGYGLGRGMDRLFCYKLKGSEDSALRKAIAAADRVVDHDNWEDVVAFYKEVRAAAGLTS